MCESTNTNIERRVLMRFIVETLAEPLEGEDRERFLASANEAINRDFPPVSRQSMRAYLTRTEAIGVRASDAAHRSNIEQQGDED